MPTILQQVWVYDYSLCLRIASTKKKVYLSNLQCPLFVNGRITLECPQFGARKLSYRLEAQPPVSVMLWGSLGEHDSWTWHLVSIVYYNKYDKLLSY